MTRTYYCKGNFSKYVVIAYNGKEYKIIHTHTPESFCCTPETNTIL